MPRLSLHRNSENYFDRSFGERNNLFSCVPREKGCGAAAESCSLFIHSFSLTLACARFNCLWMLFVKFLLISTGALPKVN